MFIAACAAKSSGFSYISRPPALLMASPGPTYLSAEAADGPAFAISLLPDLHSAVFCIVCFFTLILKIKVTNFTHTFDTHTRLLLVI